MIAGIKTYLSYPIETMLKPFLNISKRDKIIIACALAAFSFLACCYQYYKKRPLNTQQPDPNKDKVNDAAAKVLEIIPKEPVTINTSVPQSGKLVEQSPEKAEPEIVEEKKDPVIEVQEPEPLPEASKAAIEEEKNNIEEPNEVVTKPVEVEIEHQEQNEEEALASDKEISDDEKEHPVEPAKEEKPKEEEAPIVHVIRGRPELATWKPRSGLKLKIPLPDVGWD